ncbi:Inner membrane protein YjgN [Marinomonas gallaica]|uniref:Inner membrane protein YjgN n=1 Tax=Marinomonas gallaica TaxID=1806667 RepID=A0A1C3JN59_9GAMM|nr:YjgN family protein [Marinomonas gallaica]SBT16688.1 Inner membrane protein YjgN [Marinomonas gallaica]SBT20404.1 Inner membrane protein YjgN [Marinomonas gallaica]
MDSSLSTDTRVSAISFSAGKWEYFKLWIVNLVLTVVTLGIYSAWAKVRNTQYLYGHTQIEGHRLQYLATPMQLLKGRLIALVLFIIYMLSSAFMPLVAALLALVVMFVTPYLMVKGLQFSLRHTAYRNVRFGFTGSIGGAYMNFMLLPLLGVLSLGLAMPWVIFRTSHYIYNNILFGKHEFEADLSVKTFYKAGLIAFALFMVPVVLLFLMGMQTMSAAGGPPLGMVFASYALFFVAFSVFHVIIRNHIMNGLSARNLVSFRSDLQIGRYLGVMASNALIVVFTLGLGFPVAQVRMNKLLADATEVHLTPEVDRLVASSSELDSAFGEEMSGFFDADLSIT